MSEETKVGKKILFYFVGSEIEGIVIEDNPTSFGSIKYIYKAKDKFGYKYLIQKTDLISIE